MRYHRIITGALITLAALAIGAGVAALFTMLLPDPTLNRKQETTQVQANSTPIVIPTQIATTTPTSSVDTGPTEEAEPQVPTVQAQNYLATNLTTGSTVETKRAGTRWPLASITKLVTAAVALDEIPAGTPIPIVEVPGGNPSRAGIPVGETYVLEDVLKVMLLSSSNEAAESLAAYGGRAAFITSMNAKVNSWGLTKTVFEDASGLSPVNQSTASEVTKIAQSILTEHPEIFAITRNQRATVYALDTQVPYTAYTTHALAGDTGFVGGKTGYTDEARGNLLTLVRKGGSTYAIVVLGSEQRFTDTRLIRSTL